MKTYVANELNQYTAIANPGAVGLRGDATNTAVVTVNGSTVHSDSIASSTVPWHFALMANNANEPDYTFAEIMAVVNPSGTNTPDIVSTASGSVYAPPQAEVLTYDDDGNLVSDGHWQYTWNGENRLAKAEELVSPTNRQPYVVEYSYDHQGRMAWKTVASPNVPPFKNVIYLWDGFNIIAETTVADSATNITYNVWGLDLDGTLQGAGGVGGLLAVVKDTSTYIPAYDANGNIAEYVSTDGSIAAHREYDPFGGTVVATGDANAFCHWFSTKPWCPVTGLSEYQYRKYSHVLGRWLSRDPIGENGGVNVYVYAANNTQGETDCFGLSIKIDTSLSDYMSEEDAAKLLENHLWKRVIEVLWGWDDPKQYRYGVLLYIDSIIQRLTTGQLGTKLDRCPKCVKTTNEGHLYQRITRHREAFWIQPNGLPANIPTLKTTEHYMRIKVPPLNTCPDGKPLKEVFRFISDDAIELNLRLSAKGDKMPSSSEDWMANFMKSDEIEIFNATYLSIVMKTKGEVVVYEIRD